MHETGLFMKTSPHIQYINNSQNAFLSFLFLLNFKKSLSRLEIKHLRFSLNFEHVFMSNPIDRNSSIPSTDARFQVNISVSIQASCLEFIQIHEKLTPLHVPLNVIAGNVHEGSIFMCFNSIVYWKYN